MANPVRLEQKGGAIWIAGGILVHIEGHPEELVIPEGVTEIVILAEWDKKQLKRLTFPGSLKEIPEKAFQSCTQLEEITFSEGLESIGDFSFSLAKRLKAVTFPESLRSIGIYAFSSCTMLRTISLNRGLARIGGGAFTHAKITEMEIPESVKEIGSLAFSCCRDLRSVRIPESVEQIHPDAFYNCEAVTVYTPEGSAADRVAEEKGLSRSRAASFFRPEKPVFSAIPPERLPGNARRLGYERLDPVRQECYCRIAEGLWRMEDRIDLLDLPTQADILRPVMKAMEMDYPQIFWADWFRTRAGLGPRFKPVYWIDREEQLRCQAELEEAAAGFLAELPEGTGQYGKARKVLERICARVAIEAEPVRALTVLKRRDGASGSPWTAYGALVNRQANSIGAAAGCQHLLQALGIECVRRDDWNFDGKHTKGYSRVIARLDGQVYSLYAVTGAPKMEPGGEW